MRGKHDQDRLEALRERLYARGERPRAHERTKLSDDPKDVPASWDTPPASERPSADGPRPVIDMAKRRSYRTTVLVTAVSFFVAAVVLSSLFIMFGGNAISGENITISVNGPFTVGGGEDMPIQIGITNQNSVPIESATLIVEYPEGTQSTTEENRELFIERVPLDVIRSGETVNIPLRARVFGEENAELEIRASVEYRVTGSNATFFKEAEPLRFKITSSPISIDVEAVETIAAGQTYEMTLTVSSNASTPLTNLLVQADFPSGFDFTASSPGPISGQNTWRIDELAPEESTEITIEGILTGTERDTRVTHFSVGLPNARDQFTLASIFGTASSEVSIEQPFIDVSVAVDGQTGDLAVSPGEASEVTVRITNSLDEAVYNAEVAVQLSGNALSDVGVRAANGFYDSNTHTVTWDTSSNSRLAELLPGASEQLRFTIAPDTNAVRTPQIDLAASVRARRVRESSVSEALLGSAAATIRVTSNVSLEGATGRGEGPLPPVVGEMTSYLITLTASGGGNDVADATVTTSLPTYVTWAGTTAGDGTFSYNAANRTIEWDIGDLSANGAVTGWFEVSILPSASQVDTTPTLVGEQRLRGEDRFSGAVVRATSPALTTRLANGEDNGRVEAD